MYSASGISKSFGGVNALADIDLEIRPGEVQALLGANGAGKSTLVKILVGAEQPTRGTLTLDNQDLRLDSVDDAGKHGIAIASQELNLFPELDVLQNLFMMREPRYGGVLLNRREMERVAEPVMDTIGLQVRPDRQVKSLRLAERQLLEIARSLLAGPKILFLDEPTSALQASDSARVLDVVRRLRDTGVAIVYVSHFLEDVFAISDTITVLRNGRVEVQRRPTGQMSISETVHEMLGDIESRQASFDPRPSTGQDRSATTSPLVFRGIAVKKLLSKFDLTVEPGEVVGLAGLEGSGPTAVLDSVFGRCQLTDGAIDMPDGQSAPASMAAAVRAGVAFIPADRAVLGVMLDKTIYENISIISAGPLRRMGLLPSKSAMVRKAQGWRSRLNIAMSSTESEVGQLSGGNQQKVVFAKWLDTDPTVVLLDDPSRGVDVGAKVEMHAIIRQMAMQQRIVLMASTDLAELATVCDRVVIFFQGAAVGEISGDRLSEHALLAAINVGVVAMGPTNAELAGTTRFT